MWSAEVTFVTSAVPHITVAVSQWWYSRCQLGWSCVVFTSWLRRTTALNYTGQKKIRCSTHKCKLLTEFLLYNQKTWKHAFTLRTTTPTDWLFFIERHPFVCFAIFLGWVSCLTVKVAKWRWCKNLALSLRCRSSFSSWQLGLDGIPILFSRTNVGNENI